MGLWDRDTRVVEQLWDAGCAGHGSCQVTLCLLSLPVGSPLLPAVPRRVEGDAGWLGLGRTRGGQEKTRVGMRQPPPTSLGGRSSISSTPEMPSAGGGSFPKVLCGMRTGDFWVSPHFVVLS